MRVAYEEMVREFARVLEKRALRRRTRRMRRIFLLKTALRAYIHMG